MADLLIPLYGEGGTRGRDGPGPIKGVHVRRALAHERRPLLGWVEEIFGAGWAGEVEVGLGSQPATCFLAAAGTELVGFCCYDTTYRGFLGPMGVEEKYRHRGIGRVLLWTALHAMWHSGYAYAVVGASGATEFYQKAAGAWEIPESIPGPYPPRLQGDSG